MTRLRTASLGGLLLTAALLATARAAEDETRFAGLWQEEVDGYKVTWTIGYWSGKWTVTALGQKPQEKTAVWQGTDVQVADGKLMFTRKLGANAPAGWGDGARIMVQPGGERELSYAADGKEGKLTRTYEVVRANDLKPDGPATRPGDPVKPPADPRPGVGPRPGDRPAAGAGAEPTADDLKPFVGMWTGEADGFREVWTIKVEDGKGQVSAVYLDPQMKKPPFVMNGANLRFRDGKLVFVAKLGPGAPRHWRPDTEHTVEATKDSLSYSYFGGGRTVVKVPANVIESAFSGTWGCEIDGYTELWTIRKMASGWRVAANLAAPGKRPTRWQGVNVQFKDNKLTFTQALGLNPPAGWADKSAFTVEWDGAGLVVNWSNGDKKGETRRLTLLRK